MCWVLSLLAYIGARIDLLAIYLKANVSAEEEPIVLLILSIFARTLPHVSRQSPKFIQEVESELIQDAIIQSSISK